MLDYKARYGKVSKLRYDSKSGKYGGKTVSVYGHIPVDEASSFSSDAHITPFYDDGSINLQVPASSTWNRTFWIDANKGYSPVLTLSLIHI